MRFLSPAWPRRDQQSTFQIRPPESHPLRGQEEFSYGEAYPAVPCLFSFASGWSRIAIERPSEGNMRWRRRVPRTLFAGGLRRNSRAAKQQNRRGGGDLRAGGCARRCCGDNRAAPARAGPRDDRGARRREQWENITRPHVKRSQRAVANRPKQSADSSLLDEGQMNASYTLRRATSADQPSIQAFQRAALAQLLAAPPARHRSALAHSGAGSRFAHRQRPLFRRRARGPRRGRRRLGAACAHRRYRCRALGLRCTRRSASSPPKPSGPPRIPP